MLHLVHKQTGATYTGDALGIPATEWREGDIILQRHKITLPPDIQDGPYDVEVGVYWLDTLERWKVISQQQTGNNVVVMTQLTRK